MDLKLTFLKEIIVSSFTQNKKTNMKSQSHYKSDWLFCIKLKCIWILLSIQTEVIAEAGQSHV